MHSASPNGWSELLINSVIFIFEFNYYSVPSQYAGEKIIAESDGKQLRILRGRKLITQHPLTAGKGQRFTIESHKPFYKQVKTVQY